MNQNIIKMLIPVNACDFYRYENLLFKTMLASSEILGKYSCKIKDKCLNYLTLISLISNRLNLA